MAHGKEDAAREILIKYHGNGDPDSAIVRLTMKEMAANIELDASDKRWWDYRELYNTRASRYRLFCIWVMAFLSSFMGNAVASYFLPVMLQKAGISSEHYQLLINALNTVCSAVCAFIGCLFVDRVGRRKMLLGGTASLCIFLCIICALTATGEDRTKASPASARALVASIILFGCSFSAGWTPMQVLYPLECMNFTMRAKGMVSFWS
jgi:MFS family permease